MGSRWFFTIARSVFDNLLQVNETRGQVKRKLLIGAFQIASNYGNTYGIHFAYCEFAYIINKLK